jgi:tripartite-type tricarboxylate transporter receptor subunit TctC
LQSSGARAWQLYGQGNLAKIDAMTCLRRQLHCFSGCTFSGFALVLLGALAPAGSAAAQDVAAFYRGRTVEVYAGSEPGSGYDGYARIVARNIGRHIPGSPNVVVKNMPAASGLAEANFLYNQAPRDGSVFGIITNNMTVEPLIGNVNARFDPAKFVWIGSADKLVNVCVAWHSTPLRTIEDLRAREWLVGGTAARSSTVQQANVFIALGGAKLKVVKGYPSTTSMILALERGELEVACGIGWDSVKSSTGYLQAGKIRPVMQLGYEPHPELKGVPFIYDMLIDPNMKDVLDFITRRLFIGRAFAAPPDIPAERAQALRDAFWAALNDRTLLAEAERQHMEILPARGEEIQKEVIALTATPKRIVELTDKVLENKLLGDAKLNWIEVKGTTLNAVESEGRVIGFSDRGRAVKADTAGAKVTIGGSAVRAADLKVGLSCDVSYLGNGDNARQVECR